VQPSAVDGQRRDQREHQHDRHLDHQEDQHPQEAAPEPVVGQEQHVVVQPDEGRAAEEGLVLVQAELDGVADGREERQREHDHERRDENPAAPIESSTRVA
jgi:hypothetical protein